MDSDAEGVLRALEEAQREALNALEGVEPHWVVYAEGEWTVKDIIGHLVAWEEEGLAALRAHLAGEEYFADHLRDGCVNGWLYEKRKDFDAERMYARWEAVRELLRCVILEMPPKQRQSLLRYPWGDYGTVEDLVADLIAHQREHLNDIVQTLDRIMQ